VITPSVWVFDVDDTLYLERDYVKSGFAAVARWVQNQFGIDGFAAEAGRLFASGRRNTTLGDSLTALGGSATPDVIAAMVNVYRRHRPDIALLPDAAELIAAVGSERSIAVITDGPVDSQRAKIDALGVPSFANPVVVTEELGADYRKPSQRAFELVASVLGAAAADCVYVADNPMKDFVAPSRLGWQTIRVRRAGSLHAAVASQTDVHLEVETLQAVVATMMG
jgi:putative hydrolase of the HAD superfamily